MMANAYQRVWLARSSQKYFVVTNRHTQLSPLCAVWRVLLRDSPAQAPTSILPKGVITLDCLKILESYCLNAEIEENNTRRWVGEKKWVIRSGGPLPLFRGEEALFVQISFEV